MKGLSITALVFAILSFFVAITIYGSEFAIYIAPFGIIFGIVAIVMISKYNSENPDKKESNAMAIISIVLSTVAFLIGCLFALIYMDDFMQGFEEGFEDAMNGYVASGAEIKAINDAQLSGFELEV